jgi:hypothetical protein
MWIIYYRYNHVIYVNKMLSIVNFHIFDDMWNIYNRYNRVIVVNKKLSIVKFSLSLMNHVS